MSKYDFEVNLDVGSSTGMILNKISPNSTILEFGCATGRMTKYMKSALNCRVYIVEYEKEAYSTAIQFAEDGVCDDILSLSWMEKFQGISFDTILFVDVLEHLCQPEFVLAKASEMLKEEGIIYVSIPNIAHNDIILKAINNHFDYMNLGILDDTHVHFWAYENIVPFVRSCGLHVHSIEATYCLTGSTEQYRNETLKCSSILLNYLNERKYADAYQFIIEIGKQRVKSEHEEIVAVNIKKASIISHLYLDRGNDFEEKDVIEFESENIESGRYVAHFVLDNIRDIKRVRFDPVEQQGCILQNFCARQAGKKLQGIYSEYLELENGKLMVGSDPMVIVDLVSECDALTIDADIVILGDEYLELLQTNCYAKQSENIRLINEVKDFGEKVKDIQDINEKLNAEIDNLNLQNAQLSEEINGLRVQNERLNGAINNLNVQNEKLNGEISNLNVQNEKLNEVINDLTKENGKLTEEAGGLNEKNERLFDQVDKLNVQNETLNKDISKLNAQNIQLQSEISSYILLVNKKDDLLITGDKSLKEHENLIVDKNEYIAKLEQRVDYFENRTCVRVCNKFWKIYWKIKLGIRKVLRKKESNE